MINDEYVIRRQTGLRLMKRGLGNKEIAKRLGVSSEAVRRWRNTVEEHGESSLFSLRRGVTNRKISDEQWLRIIEVIASSAKTHGFESSAWSIERLRAWMKHAIDYAPHPETLRKALKKRGISLPLGNAEIVKERPCLDLRKSSGSPFLSMFM